MKIFTHEQPETLSSSAIRLGGGGESDVRPRFRNPARRKNGYRKVEAHL